MSKKHRGAARGKQRRKYEASNSAIYVIMAKTQRYTPDEQRKLQTPVYLALQRGRRSIIVHVPICHSGPCLMDIWMTAVAPAPSQRELFRSAAC